MARASVNKSIILGTLGKDPEVRFAANGTAIANLSVATSESWKDRATGEKQEKTEWHRVVIIGKLAEIAQQYLKKGSQVYLEGKLQTRKWQDQNSGQDRYTTEIVLDFNGVMQMLGGGSDDGGQGGYQQPPMNQGQQPAQAPMQGQGQQPMHPPMNQVQQPAQAPMQGQMQGQGQQGGYQQQMPMQGGFGAQDDDVPFCPVSSIVY